MQMGDEVSHDALKMAAAHRELRLEFEDLLAFEADLLDQSRLTEWLQLLDDSVRYRVPTRIDNERGTEDFERPGLLCHFDDDKVTLTMRAQRVEGGLGFADDPPPRTRHIISSVRIVRVEPGTVEVKSNFMLFRSHVGLPDHYLTGVRCDRWVGKPNAWRLRERLVILDQSNFHGMAALF